MLTDVQRSVPHFTHVNAVAIISTDPRVRPFYIFSIHYSLTIMSPKLTRSELLTITARKYKQININK